uniref:Cathelicidin-related antimicrobial peptide Na_CRAMP n=1 Tax=Naja atra TaxID=8656 RepID=CAMP_NAJAT|nr:RecName: Full=Cathelicidin-related antimicrobial peptide Na_CRAMP; AltName: Full=Cathelicidin-NA antimicrobial peptide; AltName: Full=Vipericidin; Flags: Precursor [Naja atra]ACF21000.1 cathelicidin-related protein precursor [Naja atra]
MEGFFWKTLLVVGALTISGTSSFPHKPLTYEEAVDLAVSVYNSKSGEDSLYRLLEAVPALKWDALSESNQELNFSVKETVCQMAEERSLEECDFQEAGAVMGCTGYYFFGESPPVLVLTCKSVGNEEEQKQEEGNEEEKEVEKEEKEEDQKDQPKRVKRFKKFFKKLKNSVKKRAKKFFKKPKVIGVTFPF